jgi:molybdopterin-guanine dinucleotide biosynthesis protein A
MKQPAGIILAGGQSRRMGGGDKGLLSLGGETLLARVIARLEPQVAEVALNANGDGTRFKSFGLPVIADSVAEHPGPLAGVLAGMDWAAARGHSHIVTAAADTPFFPCDLVPRLMLASESAPIALAATPDPERGMARHPTFGLWPVDLRDDLRAALSDGVRKVVAWTDKHGTAIAEFSATPFDPFFNVNTPEDMARAEGLL